MTTERRAAGHTCHAFACEARVPPRMHMCRKHWFMVPKPLQDALWANYRRGQERTMTPSIGYLHAAAACVRAVAEKEGHPADAIDAECGLYLTWAEMLEEATPAMRLTLDLLDAGEEAYFDEFQPGGGTDAAS